MAGLGIFSATGQDGTTGGSWYWGVAKAGRTLTREEFRWPGKGGRGGAWFTARIDRAHVFWTEVAARAALGNLLEEYGYPPEALRVLPVPDVRRGPIVEGGILRIPLYHGTSDLFLESIREHGLGGADPLASLRVLDFLRDLVDWCDLRSEADAEFAAWWSGRRLELEPTKLRSSGVLDFRNGRTWMTPSRRAAARYALMNAYGSEAVSEALRLYEDVTVRAPGQLEELPFAASPVLALRGRRPSPILLEAEAVSLDDLRGDSGVPAGEILRRLSEVWESSDPELFEDLTQQDHLEVARPLPIGRLRISRVVRSGDDLALPEFELRPWS